MKMFFVYEGDLDTNLYIDKLSRLTNPEMIAAFPTRQEAANYALGIIDKTNTIKIYKKIENPRVIVERDFALQGGDDNNLISECEWRMSQKQNRKDEDTENEQHELTGEISIIGDAKVGETLIVDISKLNGIGEPVFQWEKSYDGSEFIIIPNGVDDIYKINFIDVNMYIRLSVMRKGYTGAVYSEMIGLVVGE